MADIKTDIETIESLEKEWKALLLNSSHNNLFLSWEWISSWCIHMLKKTETPVIITARDGGKLVGIAPLLHDKHRFLGDYYHIIGQQYSYHLGFIAETGKEDVVFSALFNYLFNAIGKKLFVFDFKHLDEDPVFQSVLRNEVVKRGFQFDKGVHDPCRVLDLTQRFEEYLEEGISSDNLRNNIRKDLKRLRKDYEFQYFDADKNNFETYWTDLLFLHRKEMNDRKMHSVLKTDNFPAHIRNTCNTLNENKSVRVAVIKVNDITASILLGIVYNGVFNALTIGLSGDLKQKLPWANLCVLSTTFAIKSAIESGCYEFDFLGGDHDFKKKMGGKAKGGIRITLYSSKFHKIFENVMNRLIQPLFSKFV